MIDVSEDELERTLRQVERLVLVDFWHPSCEPCRELRQQLEALNEEACLLLALDASRHPLAAARHRVSDFPTVIFFKRGLEVHRFKGGALPASTLALLGPAS